MHFEAEAQALYHQVHGLAQRNKRKAAKQGMNPYLTEMDTCLVDMVTAEKVDVGVLEIPVNQIVGNAAGLDKYLYESGFLPLSPIGSEYAGQWCQLYMDYLSDEGIRDPIICYEYLGRFYVVDGKKRVSVLKCCGASTVKAAVTRFLPTKSDNEEIQRYYEFLDAFEKTRLYQISFTQPGSFPKLQKALGYDVDHVWTEGERFSFMFAWHGIEQAFQQAFRGCMNVTTADALLVLLEDHTYKQIRNTPPWILARLFQAAWKKLHIINVPDAPYELDHDAKKVS